MAALLNRGWRLIGTALGFTLFGVGGLLLSQGRERVHPAAV